MEKCQFADKVLITGRRERPAWRSFSASSGRSFGNNFEIGPHGFLLSFFDLEKSYSICSTCHIISPFSHHARILRTAVSGICSLRLQFIYCIYIVVQTCPQTRSARSLEWGLGGWKERGYRPSFIASLFRRLSSGSLYIPRSLSVITLSTILPILKRHYVGRTFSYNIFEMYREKL
jgi:hypothetical protein